MSNYALQNQLNQLEGELRKVQSYNSELHRELSTIANGVFRANNELENYNTYIRSTLENCDGSMQSSHRRVVDAIALQGEIEHLYTRFKNVELANKKIRAANNKKYYDFANYRSVRKIVQGMMDNLDVQMVSDQAILKSVEKEHLQTPDYWLTCVLISVMAWRQDDRELAERALARAVKLDKKNSAVFYMLFNLRMKREEAALKWFLCYQECDLKGSDQRTFLMLFSLVSKTVAEEVDEKTKNEVLSFLKKVIDQNTRSSGYSEEEVVGRICRFFGRMQPAEEIPYPMLRKYCVEQDLLSGILTQAKGNLRILEFILQTVNVPAEEKNAFLKSYIDEIIALPNQAEQGVYDEIAYNECIIRLEGDVEMAKVQFAEAQKKKASELNLIAEMIDWIYERDAKDVNGQIRRNMFTLTKGLQEKAVETYVRDYRERRRTGLQVSIGEYSTVMDFGREDEEQKKLERFHTERRDAALSEVKDFPAYIGFGVGAAAAVGSFFVGLWLLILTAGGAGYGLLTLLSHRAKRKQLRQSCAERCKADAGIVRQMFEEFRQYEKEFVEYDAFYDRILDEMHKI